MMLFKKSNRHKSKKTTEIEKNEPDLSKSSNVGVKITATVRKISDREIALGYMLW